MSHKTDAMDQPVKFSRKCRECGLRNFIDATVCRRCEADLSQRSIKAKEPTKTKDIEQIPDQSVEPEQSKVRSLSILAAALVILFALVLFYGKQFSQASEPVAGQVEVGQSATESDPSAQDTTTEYSPNEAPAKQILVVLNRFQDTPKSDMSYEEYDQMLTRLKADLNKTLPTFVRHDPGDESFRKEVSAAIRDYTAAGNWWKTTIQNSKVLTDVDRLVRVQNLWGSAQTHLDNAEKLLQP
jgi:ribosomal protein L40E